MTEPKPKRHWIPNPKGNPWLYAYQLQGRMLKNPNYKAVQLFKVLEQIKLPYERYVFEKDSDPEHLDKPLLMTAQLQIEGVTTYIELVGRRDYAPHTHTMRVQKRKIAHCERMGIPLLQLDRKHTPQLMAWIIRRWYAREHDRIIRMKELERRANEQQPE